MRSQQVVSWSRQGSTWRSPIAIQPQRAPNIVVGATIPQHLPPLPAHSLAHAHLCRAFESRHHHGKKLGHHNPEGSTGSLRRRSRHRHVYGAPCRYCRNTFQPSRVATVAEPVLFSELLGSTWGCTRGTAHADRRAFKPAGTHRRGGACRGFSSGEALGSTRTIAPSGRGCVRKKRGKGHRVKNCKRGRVGGLTRALMCAGRTDTG